MSGICGILRLDGGPPEGIEAMAARLQQRGPEGTHLFRDRSCALGHTLLATTPEALVERQPFSHSETGCTITADLRLDNRDDLIRALGLGGQSRVIGDAEIVLIAYLRWGEDCPHHLLGDFAFAVWDPRHRRMFCARDHMGMKQLIWCHVAGRVFAFASAPSAVLMAEGVPRQINEGRIADFLEGYLEVIDDTSTFFNSVFRLPAAHRITVNESGLRVERYWTLEAGKELKLDSDEAYEEAFLDVFTSSVRDRLRAPDGTVGSMLSGGMDSGSTAAIAARILDQQGRGRLPTFSGVGPTPENCIETRTIYKAINIPNLNPILVNWGELDGWKDDLRRFQKQSEEPFDWGFDLVRACYVAARRSGVKVVFDGVGGDIVFASGTYNARLLAEGKFAQLWGEAKGEEAFWNAGWKARNSLLWAGRQYLIPFWARELRQAYRSHTRKVPRTSLVPPDMARRVDLVGRINLWAERDPWRWGPYAAERIRSILALEVVVGRERYERTAAVAGIEPRDAFLDLRVIDFCLSLPMNQLQRDGWPKHLLRRAMKGRMPDAVRWRKGKENIGFAFTKQLMIETRDERQKSMKPHLDVPPLSLWNMPRTGGQVGDDSVILEEVSALSDWLSHVATAKIFRQSDL